MVGTLQARNETNTGGNNSNSTRRFALRLSINYCRQQHVTDSKARVFEKGRHSSGEKRNQYGERKLNFDATFRALGKIRPNMVGNQRPEPKPQTSVLRPEFGFF